jgi:hypothetical protein
LANDIAGVFKGKFCNNAGRGGLIEKNLWSDGLAPEECNRNNPEDEGAEKGGFQELPGVEFKFALLTLALTAGVIFPGPLIFTSGCVGIG